MCTTLTYMALKYKIYMGCVKLLYQYFDRNFWFPNNKIANKQRNENTTNYYNKKSETN